MQDRFSRRFRATAAVFIAVLFSGAHTQAATLTWGVNGAGGSGNWNTSTANWYNGSQNVVWPSGGDAVFAGASGGTVTSYFFGPVVSSMTFNTPGYVIQDGWVQSGTNGLTVTTNVDATINSTVTASATAGDFLVKNGPAALSINDTNFLGALQVNQGEVRANGSSSLFFSNVTLANQPGVIVTLGQSGSSASMAGLAGGGTSGGIVRPDTQARTVTLTLYSGGNFDGKLEDNGSGILAMDLFSGTETRTLTNVNPYSGPTSVSSGTLALAGNGSAVNSPVSVFSTLLLDNSGTVVANRISDSAPLVLAGGAIQLKGNTTTSVEELLGQLNLSAASSLAVTQPGSAAAQLTFAGLQRTGHATLNISGPGVGFTGMANGSTGIVAPYMTAGNEWAIVGGDGRIAAFSAYATDINAGLTTDHVKLAGGGTTPLAAETTRASLNLQNNTSVGQTLDLAGHSLALTTGGILSSGAGASTIRSGSLSTPAQELIVTANNSLTISSPIVDSGSGAALVKTGPGVLTLGGTNTYTGPTAILQGTLVVASDANLGLASTIDLGAGTLQAAANFSSAKGFTSTSSLGGSIDTAGFNIEFSGANNGYVGKTGLGMLTLTNPTTGLTEVGEGVLNLVHATSGNVMLRGGTLQAAGTLSVLNAFAVFGTPILDLGGSAAATLTTGVFESSGNGSLQIDFGIGSAGSDFWAIPNHAFPFPSNPGAFQFEFKNLGGVRTGVDYPLMSFSTFPTPSSSLFALAPDMAAAGWKGTFTPTETGVSVRFSTVPEPTQTAILLIQGALFAFAARRYQYNRKNTRQLPAQRFA